MQIMLLDVQPSSAPEPPADNATEPCKTQMPSRYQRIAFVMFVSFEPKPKLVDAPDAASAVAPFDDCTLNSYFVWLCMVNVTGPMLFLLSYGVGG